MMYRYDPDSKDKGGEERDFEKKTAETGDWQAGFSTLTNNLGFQESFI